MVQDKFFDNRNPNSLAIAVKSTKANNYAENIKYHICFYRWQTAFFL